MTDASVQARDAAPGVVAGAVAEYPILQDLFVDAGYAGSGAQTRYDQHGLRVEVVRHPATGMWVVGGLQPKASYPRCRTDGFVVLAKRWVALRTPGTRVRSA